MKLVNQDNIGLLMIDSPNSNAIDQVFIEESIRLFDEAANDDSIRAVLFTSTNPRVFCAGLNPFIATKFSYDEMFKYIKDLNLLYYKIFGFPKPTVVAINGQALGGGCIMSLTADHRIMAEGNFQIGIIELGLGMPIPFGLISMLEYIIGNRIAERIIFSAQKYSPEQAMELGLVDELAKPEDLMVKAIEKARVLGEKPALAFRRNKEYFRKTALEGMKSEKPRHLKEWVECWFSEECQKAIGKIIKQLTKK